VTLPLIYVLEPKLVHFFYFFLFYLSPLLMVISAGLRILYSFLHRKYVSHTHFFPPALVFRMLELQSFTISHSYNFIFIKGAHVQHVQIVYSPS
jgi:hypothetical protein